MTVFRKTVEAEERVVLMKKLINKRVGLAEIEHFFCDLAEKCRNVQNKYCDKILERNAWV